MRFSNWCAVVLALCFASSTLAGIQYTTVSKTENASSTSEFQWDGKNMKTTFTSSGDPVLAAGMYVLSNGPEAVYMVNPGNRKYARLSAKDIQKMQQDTAQMADDGGGTGMKTETRDFKVTKDLDEAGPTLVGLPTRHLRYTISYKMVMSHPSSPMAITNNMETTEEFWSTREFTLPLPEETRQMTTPSLGGMGEITAKMQEAQRQMDEHGFMLKRITTAKTSMGGMMGAMTLGRGAGSTSTMEVTALNRNATFPPGTFELPKGYAEVDFFNLMSKGSMPDLTSVPGKEQGQQMPDLSKEPRQ